MTTQADLEQAERAMAEALAAGDYSTAGELGRAIHEALHADAAPPLVAPSGDQR